VSVDAHGGEKNGRNLQGKFLSAPQAVHESIFRTFLLGGEIWRVGVLRLVVLACVLWAMTKKGRQLFLGKSAPPENPGYAYATPHGQNVCLCHYAIHTFLHS